MIFEPIIEKTPDDHDANDVRWKVKGKKQLQGFGFKGKLSQNIQIIKCPKCNRENYMAQKVCAWCGFDPN